MGLANFDIGGVVCAVERTLLADLDTDGQVLRSYTWGPGVDNLLTMTVHGSTETNSYYALKDHLGSVLALADENGNIAESYEYDAWGNVLKIRDGSGNVLSQSAVGNRYLFQGREYDQATGLYYFRARWYDPVTGRWFSKDPIGISGGLNQYVFCGNNPVNFIDPWGLDIWVASRGWHQNISVGDPNGNYSSYSLRNRPTFTILGIPVHLDVLNPWNNGGEIYRDFIPAKPNTKYYLSTTPDEDQEALDLLDDMVGNNLPYRLIGSTCRDFSKDMFLFFKDDLHYGENEGNKGNDDCEKDR